VVKRHSDAIGSQGEKKKKHRGRCWDEHKLHGRELQKGELQTKKRHVAFRGSLKMGEKKGGESTQRISSQ